MCVTSIASLQRSISQNDSERCQTPHHARFQCTSASSCSVRTPLSSTTRFTSAISALLTDAVNDPEPHDQPGSDSVSAAQTPPRVLHRTSATTPPTTPHLHPAHAPPPPPGSRTAPPRVCILRGPAAAKFWRREGAGTRAVGGDGGWVDVRGVGRGGDGGLCASVWDTSAKA